MSEASDPLPPLARDILSLFEDELADQRFGDVDRAVLEELAERTRDDASRVSAARDALDEALAGLERSRAELVRRAEQGLAYARVFAREDTDLAARLEALEARSTPTKKKPKRRAPKKSAAKPAADVAELPFVRTG